LAARLLGFCTGFISSSRQSLMEFAVQEDRRHLSGYQICSVEERAEQAGLLDASAKYRHQTSIAELQRPRRSSACAVRAGVMLFARPTKSLELVSKAAPLHTPVVVGGGVRHTGHELVDMGPSDGARLLWGRRGVSHDSDEQCDLRLGGLSKPEPVNPLPQGFGGKLSKVRIQGCAARSIQLRIIVTPRIKAEGSPFSEPTIRPPDDGIPSRSPASRNVPVELRGNIFVFGIAT
jgi:hypothetical protein